MKRPGRSGCPIAHPQVNHPLRPGQLHPRAGIAWALAMMPAFVMCLIAFLLFYCD